MFTQWNQFKIQMIVDKGTDQTFKARTKMFPRPFVFCWNKETIPRRLLLQFDPKGVAFLLSLCRFLFLTSWFSIIIADMLQRPGFRLTMAILYLLIISVLFCMPGSAFPKNNWLSDIYFDKWVHIGFFAVLIILWNWAANSTHRKWSTIILVGAIAYGLLVEAVQHNFIPNRGFDIGDWIADIAGSLLGLWIWRRYIKK